jgi:aryl-alcohol dehydrogenase-like predicted oxidoreductase
MTMHYRYLGQTGVKVSTICLGCMTFEPGGADEPTARAMLDAYVAAGGNFLDMADNYPGVEDLIGRWLKGRSDRDQLIIGTKVRFPVPPHGPNDVGLTARHLHQGIDATLRRLGVDHVDVYQAHCWDFVTPIDQTVRAFGELIRQGKIRYWGASNYSGWHVTRAVAAADELGVSRPVCLQEQYSLLCRSPEWEVVPACLDAGVSLTAWSPLAAGWLSGKYSRDSVPPDGSRMARAAKNLDEWRRFSQSRTGSTVPHPRAIESEEQFQRVAAQKESDRRWRIIDAVGALAQQHGCTSAQIALAWALSRPGMASVVMGARTPEQLQENLASGNAALSADDVRWLDTVSDPGRP